MSLLAGWENFYVIVGSSAGALTGLMFVVITLIVGNQRRGSGGELAAYGTPNVFHFCAVLLLSAILSAPWQSLHVLGILLILGGFIGLAYATIIFRRIVRRARLQGGYNPVMEDWIWFATLPLIAYLALVVAAILFLTSPTVALYIIGGAMILLIFIGIHNAWDTVTFLAIEQRNQPENTSERPKDGSQ